ncbi:RICIN domain-containing protein [Nonomuraea sp. NPDC049480]|uniref:RICIN domain-containing protein n=1 Tax=Nonomuraea sp. NPDC049480 TaxID=3364353 RepID=UPI0037A95128
MILATALMAASPMIAHAQSSESHERARASLPASEGAHNIVYYGIRNYKSKKFLQPAYEIDAVGARIVQEAEAPTWYQSWNDILDGGYWSFENMGSRKNLGISGGSTAHGAIAIQANPAGDLNQDWEIRYGVHPYPAGIFVLVNRRSGLCLGISNASIENGAQAAPVPL